MQQLIPRVMVVGAGVSGLTLAKTLQLAGVNCFQVVDRGPPPSPLAKATGSAAILPPNAMVTLEHLGLAGKVRAAGTAIDTFTTRARDGGFLHELRVEDVFDTAPVHPVVIRRSALLRLLFESLEQPDKCTVWNTSVESVSPHKTNDTSFKADDLRNSLLDDGNSTDAAGAGGGLNVALTATDADTSTASSELVDLCVGATGHSHSSAVGPVDSPWSPVPSYFRSPQGLSEFWRAISGDSSSSSGGLMRSLLPPSQGRSSAAVPRAMTWVTGVSPVSSSSSAIFRGPGGNSGSALHSQRQHVTYWGRGLFVTCAPLDGSSIAWKATTGALEQDAVQALREAQRQMPEAVQQVLDGTPSGHASVTHVHPHAHALPWWSSTGPVVLLGDAAHPLPWFQDQSTAMSLESGYALGHSLALALTKRAQPHAELPLNGWLDALQSYHAIRQARVKNVLQREFAMASLLDMKSALSAFARDYSSRHVPQAVSAAEHRVLWNYDIHAVCQDQMGAHIAVPE